MRKLMMLCVVALIAAAPAQAETVMVEVTGTVEYNQIYVGPLADVNPGDSFTWTFEVDSDNYLNSSYYNTRGYVIDEASFTAVFGDATLGFQYPFPGIPYFVLRESDPVADGFFMANGNVDWPWPDCPLDETGILGQFAVHYEVGYEGYTLDSLDILDAIGTYDYTGLTSFYTVVMDGWAEPMGLEFGQMTISQPLTLPLDIKPGGCPNAFNPSNNGVLPVALLGSMEIDIDMVDPFTLTLSRVDGVGGSVSLITSGMHGTDWHYEDVSTPFFGEDCECDEAGADGYTDLVMHFKSGDLNNELLLDALPHKTDIGLVLQGSLVDGTAFSATDCVRKVGNGHLTRTVVTGK